MPDSVALRYGWQGTVPVSASILTASDNVQVRATKTQLKPDGGAGETPVPPLSRGQVMAVGVSVVLGLVVFGYGMLGS